MRSRARAVRFARRRETTRATRRRPRIRLHGQHTPIWCVHTLTNAPNTIDTPTHHPYIKRGFTTTPDRSEPRRRRRRHTPPRSDDARRRRPRRRRKFRASCSPESPSLSRARDARPRRRRRRRREGEREGRRFVSCAMIRLADARPRLSSSSAPKGASTDDTERRARDRARRRAG